VKKQSIKKYLATSATDLEFDFEDGGVARLLWQVGMLGLPLRVRINHGVAPKSNNGNY
jgi:hypothetical protein